MSLKSALAFLLVLPAIAFGQVNKQVCYEATSSGYGKIPKELCLISIQEVGMDNTLEIFSADINMPEKLKITSLSRHNEDRLNFKAEGLMAEESEGTCSESHSTTLKVEGQINSGYVAPEALNVSVELWTTNDNCHSSGQTETFEYKLKH
jgi:hypothetical protein